MCFNADNGCEAIMEDKMSRIKNSIHPDDDFHYEKMGLKRGEVEL